MSAGEHSVKVYRGRRDGARGKVRVHREDTDWGLRAAPNRSNVFEWGPSGDTTALAAALLASAFGPDDSVCYICEGAGRVEWDDSACEWKAASSPRDARPCDDCGGTGLNPMVIRLVQPFNEIVGKFEPTWEMSAVEILDWATQQHSLTTT